MFGMIAVVQENATDPFCIVRWTGRAGLSAKVIAWCGEERSVGTEGVLQMPQAVIKCCEACETALQAFIDKRKPRTTPI